MEFYIEYLEHQFFPFVLLLRFGLEAFAAGIVSWGLLRTLQHVYSLQKRKRKHRPILDNPTEFNKIRLTCGMWLVLALEFQLAADILSMAASPSFESLGKLGMIAVIRTFLNYFLGKGLEAESRELKEAQPGPAEMGKLPRSTSELSPPGARCVGGRWKLQCNLLNQERLEGILVLQPHPIFLAP